MLHAGDVRDEFDKAGRGRDGCAVRGPHHMLFPFSMCRFVVRSWNHGGHVLQLGRAPQHLKLNHFCIEPKN